MVVSEVEPTTGKGSKDGPLIPTGVKAVLALLGIALVALVAYGIGTNHGTGRHVSTGQAYVGVDQLAIKADGRVYGLQFSPDGTTWADARGTLNDSGLPPCLQKRGTTRLRFGWATATAPTGGSWRVVTWVQCIDHR